MATEKAKEAVPRSVVVGPYTYQVSFDGQQAYDFHYMGMCLYRSRRLMLEPMQSDTELPQTLLHEVIHALGNAYEIREWDRHTVNDKQEITDKIELMASALLQFMRANPKVIEYLMRPL